MEFDLGCCGSCICLCVVCVKECDSGPVPRTGSEAAAGSHQTLRMTAVTRPRGRAAGQSGQFTFSLTDKHLTVSLCYCDITALQSCFQITSLYCIKVRSSPPSGQDRSMYSLEICFIFADFSLNLTFPLENWSFWIFFWLSSVNYYPKETVQSQLSNHERFLSFKFLGVHLFKYCIMGHFKDSNDAQS